MQSNLQLRAKDPLHVSIIMDGNGRWAKAKHLPRCSGHKAGVETIWRVIEAAPVLGIGTLTLYAFSSDNWRRPRPEVQALMELLKNYLEHEINRLVAHGTRLSIIGRRDRLPARIIALAERAEAKTRHGRSLHLRIALDYSARSEIVRAAKTLAECGGVSTERFSQMLNPSADARDVDLLIRTSGEQRLSDFLLWECAYAELYFTDRLWPDFDASDLKLAVDAFARRERRFGGVSEALDPPPPETLNAPTVLSGDCAH